MCHARSIVNGRWASQLRSSPRSAVPGRAQFRIRGTSSTRRVGRLHCQPGYDFLLSELYDIDERAEGDLVKKAALRKKESAEIINTMKTWLRNQAALKTLSIGNAAAYVVANWDRLTRFLQDARIPLDNNATERAIRGPVVGRKNHYGSKSRRGTEVAATFYSLLETAKLQSVDPATYLREAALADARSEVLLPGALAR